MINQNRELIFVYNADSSLFNQVGDLIHKTLSPKTYQCNLCGLTYSGVSMKDEWRDFIKSLPLKAEFLHKDEFFKKFPNMQDINFPVVFVKQNKNLEILIPAQDINQVKSLEELRSLVQAKISNISDK